MLVLGELGDQGLQIALGKPDHAADVPQLQGKRLGLSTRGFCSNKRSSWFLGCLKQHMLHPCNLSHREPPKEQLNPLFVLGLQKLHPLAKTGCFQVALGIPRRKETAGIGRARRGLLLPSYT